MNVHKAHSTEGWAPAPIRTQWCRLEQNWNSPNIQVVIKDTFLTEISWTDNGNIYRIIFVNIYKYYTEMHSQQNIKRYTQGNSGGEVSILWAHIIGRCEKKANVHMHIYLTLNGYRDRAV